MHLEVLVSVGQEFRVIDSLGSKNSPVANLTVISFEFSYTNTAILDYVTKEKGSFPSDAQVYCFPDDPNGKVSPSILLAGGAANSYEPIIRFKFRVASSALCGSRITLGFANVQANVPGGTPIPIIPIPKTVTVSCGLVVWPGDASNDGMVSILDINPIVADYWNRTGPKRLNASLEWKAQPCPPWMPPDAIYAHTNGDGTVDIRDINAVPVNFGKTHTGTSEAPPPTPVEPQSSGLGKKAGAPNRPSR